MNLWVWTVIWVTSCQNSWSFFLQLFIFLQNVDQRHGLLFTHVSTQQHKHRHLTNVWPQLWNKFNILRISWSQTYSTDVQLAAGYCSKQLTDSGLVCCFFTGTKTSIHLETPDTGCHGNLYHELVLTQLRFWHVTQSTTWSHQQSKTSSHSFCFSGTGLLLWRWRLLFWRSCVFSRWDEEQTFISTVMEILISEWMIDLIWSVTSEVQSPQIALSCGDEEEWELHHCVSTHLIDRLMIWSTLLQQTGHTQQHNSIHQ